MEKQCISRRYHVTITVGDLRPAVQFLDGTEMKRQSFFFCPEFPDHHSEERQSFLSEGLQTPFRNMLAIFTISCWKQIGVQSESETISLKMKHTPSTGPSLSTPRNLPKRKESRHPYNDFHTQMFMLFVIA